MATMLDRSSTKINAGCLFAHPVRRDEGLASKLDEPNPDEPFAARRSKIANPDIPLPHDVVPSRSAGPEQQPGGATGQPGLELALFEILTRHHTEIITVVDGTGCILYQSPSVEQVLGYAGPNLVGHDLFALVHPDDVAALRACLAGSLDAPPETPCVLEYRLRDAAGQWRDCVSRIQDFSSHPLVHGAILFTRDIASEHETRRRLRESEARFRELTDNAADLIAIVSRDGVMTYASPSFQWTLGHTPEELTGTPLMDYVHQEDRSFIQERALSIAQVEAPASSPPTRFRVQHKNGAWRWLSGVARNCLHLPAINGLVINARDITAEALAQESLERAKRRQEEFREHLWRLTTVPNAGSRGHLKRILLTAGVALHADRASYWRYRAIDPAFVCEMMLSVETGQLDAAAEGEVVSARDNPPYFSSILANRPVVVADVRADPTTVAVAGRLESMGIGAMLDQPVWLQNAVRGVVSLEAVRPGHVWESEEQDFAANMASMVALYIEAAERREVERQLERLAWYDSLTGLANRNLFQQRLQQALKHADSTNGRLALVLLDLDRFKDLNDTMGHQAGDELLVKVADHLRRSVESSVQDNGFVARMGGDEFVILLSHVERRDEVTRLARRVLESVRSEHMLKTLDFPVTSSLGIALFPEHGRDASTLLKNADAAMYDAKREGRDNYQFYNPEKHDQTLRSWRVDSALRSALERGDLELYYQPIADLATGQLVGLEALVRVQDRERGFLNVEEFVGMAEETGAIELLSHWVLGQACQQIKTWRSTGVLQLPVSINLSGAEFRNRKLADFVIEAIDESGLDPSVLAIEITERTLVDDTEIAMGMVNRLAAFGVQIVVDDFGVGYSALSYLKRLPVARIKLDRTFVVDLPTDPDSQAITQAIVSMAKHLRLGVVAEGIETAAQAAYLRDIGCPYGQGFFFSMPLPASAVPEFLASYRPVKP
jgi:diguanylate cyclase (GGDEF)-like protein/PAS domain S-box-containing protein